MDAGFDREEAARKVVRSINRWPVAAENKPGWRTVDDWRRELEIGTGIEPAASIFSRLPPLGTYQRMTPTDQVRAADGMVTGVAPDRVPALFRNAPPSEPSAASEMADVTHG